MSRGFVHPHVPGRLLASERSLDPELVALFNALLLEAIGERASDIHHRLPLDELRQVARASGLLPLRSQALALVHAGKIAFESLPEMLTPEMLAGG